MTAREIAAELERTSAGYQIKQASIRVAGAVTGRALHVSGARPYPAMVGCLLAAAGVADLVLKLDRAKFTEAAGLAYDVSTAVTKGETT